MPAYKYWEEETPIDVMTDKNELRWFKESGKLQVSLPKWKNKAGDEVPGKTVVLDLIALSESPEAVQLLRDVLKQATE